MASTRHPSYRTAVPVEGSYRRRPMRREMEEEEEEEERGSTVNRETKVEWVRAG